MKNERFRKLISLLDEAENQYDVNAEPERAREILNKIRKEMSESDPDSDEFNFETAKRKFIHDLYKTRDTLARDPKTGKPVMNSHQLYILFRECLQEEDNIDHLRDLSLTMIDIMCTHLNDSLAKEIWKEFTEDDMVDQRYGH